MMLGEFGEDLESCDDFEKLWGSWGEIRRILGKLREFC